jgi:transcriptional regulator with XRE-family HTH domain
MTAFAVLVRRSRHAAWMTQEELAERSGLSPRTIQAIERGQVRRPHRESVRLLAKALSLHGTDRAEFEQAARQGSPAPTDSDCACDTHACADLSDPSGCLVQRLRRSVGHVDLHGLGSTADPVAVLIRLLRAAGIDLEDGADGYGFTDSLVPNHTLPAQVLPGA